jgi:hypothetical protein
MNSRRESSDEQRDENESQNSTSLHLIGGIAEISFAAAEDLGFRIRNSVEDLTVANFRVSWCVFSIRTVILAWNFIFTIKQLNTPSKSKRKRWDNVDSSHISVCRSILSVSKLAPSGLFWDPRHRLKSKLITMLWGMVLQTTLRWAKRAVRHFVDARFSTTAATRGRA